MDRITPERRSWNMSRIPSKGTAPEKLVRSALHRLGYRFRLNTEKLPGRPDIVLPRHRTVVFVHGCFWHRHRGCKLAYLPKSNISFWTSKFEANVARDKAVASRLRRDGWRVLILWECQVATRVAAQRAISRAM